MNDFSELQDDLIDEDHIPPASTILKQLTAAWINEKNCPDLLKYATEVVDCMMDQIEQMDENLQHLSRDDFRVVPHQMEVNRIRYILASYHRCRLEKIETFAEFLVKRDKATENEANRLMSPAELIFAEQFLSNMKDHFMGEAIRYMPDVLRDWNDSVQQMTVAPNMESTVFIRMLRSSPNVLVNDQIVDLPVASRHFLPYKDVINLIENGSAVFI